MAVVVASLSSCSPSSGDPSGVAGQVVARVNGTELTIHQVNALLRQIPADEGSGPAQAQGAVVERLIDEELALEKALSLGLDRNPEVMQALEQARRAILARAYLEQRMAELPQPSIEAIDTFYDQNPALFSQRRRYHLNEIELSSDRTQMRGYVRYFEQPDGSIDGLAALVRSRDMEPLVDHIVRSSDDLPAPLVSQLAKMNPGDKLYYRDGDATHFVGLQAVENAPVGRLRARRQIEAYLLGRARALTVRNELAALRREAKIEYPASAANHRSVALAGNRGSDGPADERAAQAPPKAL